MRIIIYSSDATAWSLRPFAYLFNRYWSDAQEVAVFGNSPLPFALPDNFTFTSVGPFLPVNEWTTDLRNALDILDDDVICLLMDDYWISRKVDTTAAQWMYEYMQQHPEVARFDLCTDRLYAKGITDYTRLGYLDVIRSDPMSYAHFSYQASLWRRTTLLDCLVPHESPWDSEIRGDERLRRLGALVLGTRQAPLRYTIAVQKGKFEPGGGYQTPAHEMNKEDVEYILAQDWIPAELIA